MSEIIDKDYRICGNNVWEKYHTLKYVDMSNVGVLHPYLPFAPKPVSVLAGADAGRSGNDGKGDCCRLGSLKYFTYCGFGGMLAGSISHCILTPIDLIKCRIQANPAKYHDLFHGFKTTIIETGIRGLGLGWAPTLVGYSMQGSLRFGLYEGFKHAMNKTFSPEFAYNHRTGIYLAAAAGGELFGDVLLCPWEAVKVRMQTQENFAKTMREAIPKIYRSEGIVGFYKGLPPLWMRQVSYTMMQFSSFERTLEFLYNEIVPKPRNKCTKPEQLAVTFTAGYLTGLLCAVVSHPADTIVSKLNTEKGTALIEVIKKIGFWEMWTGLGPRILMIGALAGCQWLIYDAVKVWLRIPRPPPPEQPKQLQ